MKKRIIASIAVLIIVLGGVYFYVNNSRDSEVQWRTVKLERGDLNVVVTATGTLSADTTVQVGTQVSGTIAKLYVDFNSRVHRGQVIAKLDTTLLWAAVEDAEAGVAKARVALNQAKINLERTKKLFEKQLAAQSDLDAATATYESAEADLKSAQNSLTRAKINLGYATIVAPISGVVISRNVDIGQTVAASFNTPTLFTIANDLSKMQVQASVDEADIGNVKKGQDVTFTVDAYPAQIFHGRVTQIRLQPNINQNVVDYTVIIDVPNPDLKLMPGMTANISILVASDKNVFKVPTTALRFTPPREYIQSILKDLPDSIRERFQQRMHHGGMNAAGAANSQFGSTSIGVGSTRELLPGSYFRLWILDGKRLMPVRVKLGLSDGSYTEVDSPSLKEGQEVVVGILSDNSLQSNQNIPLGGRMRF
ncbi:MAG: efflux RND transporter periplasmic adaptor subunit [Candidatus Kryptoniota bacterium]